MFRKEEKFKKKYPTFSPHKTLSIPGHLLCSCSARAILIASSLWFTQLSHLKAMNVEATDHQIHCVSTPFYRDEAHPLTQDFWKNKHLSQRLESLKGDIERKKREVLNNGANSINITDEEVQKYKDILKCPQCEISSVKDLQDIHIDNDIASSIDRDKSKASKGWSANTEVRMFPHRTDISSGKPDANLIAVKKFTDIKKGLEELFASLIALDLNPAPQEIKMARVYDAVICPQNCLSIIMEAVNKDNVHSFLSTSSSTYTVRACAKYLAKFHIKNHRKLKEGTDGEKYIQHVSWFYHSLLQNTLQEEHEEYKLLCFIPREQLVDGELVKSNTVVSLLEESQREKFERFTKIISNLFKTNAEEVFRPLKQNKEKQDCYFLTITHGDAHAHNFFYDGNIPADSPNRISMIDFATIIKTCGSVGDPAEDVGRFLAALRNWGIIEPGDNNDKKASELQREFIANYIEEIKKSGIIEKNDQEKFEKIFKNNCSFYQLRYYKAIFNVKKNDNLTTDREIKKKFLESWIEENAHLEDFASPQPIKTIERGQEKERFWIPVCKDQKDIVFWLPEPLNEFIENCPQTSNKSYLTFLWEELHHTETTTLSSTAPIAGMGGAGKTSLALAYAHEALVNKVYNVIYWFFSETPSSLLRGYRNLLSRMGIPAKDLDDEHVIELVNSHVSKKGKSLLVYDNVPNPTKFREFLGEKLPQNTHILITSRCNEGWAKNLINLDVFRPKDSIDCLLAVTGFERTTYHEQIAGKLAEELGHLPLALSHAAHYIRLAGGQEQNFKEYIEKLRGSSILCFKAYLNAFTHPKSEITYDNLIEKTLSISKVYLSETEKKLIAYSSYLNPDSIEEDIFHEHYKNQDEFKEALEKLSKLSIIKRAQNNAFSIHRLVQSVIRNEKESKEKPRSEEVFLSLVCIFNNLFKNNIDSEEKVAKLRNQLPHILEILEHAGRLEISSQELEHLGWAGMIAHVTSFRDFLIKYKKNKDVLKKIEIIHDITRNNFLPDWLQQTALKMDLKICPTILISLGKIYQFTEASKGTGDKKAFVCFAKAAIQGHAEGQYHLGKMYERGCGVTENEDGAVQWYTKSAEQGDAEAQLALGWMYARKKDKKKAVKWLTKAAEQGYGDSMTQSWLGLMYETGQGVTKNQKKAVKWYTKAAEQGDGGAQCALGEISLKSRGKDKTKAFELFTKAADQGYERAKFNLGVMYATGQGVTKNNDMMLKWFTEAAEERFTEAQYVLGSMYCAGQEVAENKEKGVKLLIRAYIKGHRGAKYLLKIIDPYPKKKEQPISLKRRGFFRFHKI